MQCVQLPDRLVLVLQAVREDRHPVLWIEEALQTDVKFETTNSRLQVSLLPPGQ